VQGCAIHVEKINGAKAEGSNHLLAEFEKFGHLTSQKQKNPD
jgi:hypothetical protein